jgi:thioesterase domain-containing protein
VQVRGPAVVSFNESGQLTPVVFFHFFDFEAGDLRRIADHLGPDQPLYAVPPPPLELVPTSLDGWMAHCRSGLDALALDAPHRLAGYSFGGVIALEVARQLQAEGAVVAWLGLVDSMRPVPLPKGIRPYVRYHRRAVKELSDNDARRIYLRRLFFGAIHRKRLRIGIALNRILVRLHVAHGRPTTVREARGWTALEHSLAVSYRRYLATPYDHPVALFCSEGSRDIALGDIYLGWSQFVRFGLTAMEIDGKHDELFSPENIHSIGGAIRASLADAREPSSLRE